MRNEREVGGRAGGREGERLEGGREEGGSIGILTRSPAALKLGWGTSPLGPPCLAGDGKGGACGSCVPGHCRGGDPYFVDR